MGIPAIVGVGEIPLDFNGKTALLDGGKGTLTISPSREEESSFLSQMRYEDKIAIEHDKYMRSLLNTPAVTRGGHRVMIYANIGDSSEVEGHRTRPDPSPLRFPSLHPSPACPAS